MGCVLLFAGSLACFQGDESEKVDCDRISLTVSGCN